MAHPRSSTWREGPLRRLVSFIAEPLFGTERHDTWIRGGWWPRYLAVAVLVATVILCRRLDVVSRPQFWAEDGSIFFCDALTLGFPRAVFRLYMGFPYLGQRLIAAFGSLSVGIPFALAQLTDPAVIALGPEISVVPAIAGSPSDSGVSRRIIASIAAPSSAIPAGTKKQSRQL